MPWATNPLFKPTAEPPADVEAAAANSSPDPDTDTDTDLSPQQDAAGSIDDGFKEPTEKFTAHQIFYIFILDGLGAMILSGGINFAIAYGIFISFHFNHVFILKPQL